MCGVVVFAISLIFPRIRDVLSTLETADEKRLDALFAFKCQWLSTLSATQIGVEDVFQMPEPTPAERAKDGGKVSRCAAAMQASDL